MELSTKNRRLLVLTKRLAYINPYKYGRKLGIHHINEIREIFNRRGFTNITDEEIISTCSKLFDSVWRGIGVCCANEVEVFWRQNMNPKGRYIFTLARQLMEEGRRMEHIEKLRRSKEKYYERRFKAD